ncbi:MAG: mechanosensitive ion channel family protein [Anaerolineae bacterium]
MDFDTWLNYNIFDNTVLNWLIALGVAWLVTLALRIVRSVVSRWLSKRYEKTRLILDDFLYHASERTWIWLGLAAAIFTALALLKTQPDFAPMARAIALLLGLVQIALWGSSGINVYTSHRVEEAEEKDPSVATAMNAVSIIAKVLLWSLLLLMALDNIPGLEINTLIASLGVGSVAVALAVQNILEDLFAALSIAFDKPFEIGDFINVGDYRGTVEHVGIKSTRLRSLTGEQLVLSNSDLLNSRIRNFKRMKRRRSVFNLGVAVDTPYDKLKQIPDILREIVTAQPEIDFDRAHFTTFGNYTLDFEVVYFVSSPDYTLFMDTQQAINLEIYRRFEEEGIELPYPTQVVVVKPQGGNGD